MLDPLTGMRIELHEEGGSIFQYVLQDGTCKGDLTKTSEASSGQAMIANHVIVPDADILRFMAPYPDKQILSHSVVEDIWKQKSYVMDYKFFDNPNYFITDEWFQLTRFKFMNPKLPGTFHRNRTVYRKISDSPRANAKPTTGTTPEKLQRDNTKCPYVYGGPTSSTKSK
jgi:hypothetical protein